MILTQVIITPNLTFVGSTADFIKILEQSNSHRVVLVVGTFYQPQCKPIGNSLTSKIFIKSAEYLTSLKFGFMITWVNTIVQKIFRCHSNKR